MAWEIIGYLGGLLIALALIPQLVKTWKTKSAKDISMLWTIILLIGLFLYTVYAIKNMIVPLMIFASLESVMAIALIFLKIKFDRAK